MGVEGGMKLVKFLVFFFNFIFWVRSVDYFSISVVPVRMSTFKLNQSLREALTFLKEHSEKRKYGQFLLQNLICIMMPNHQNYFTKGALESDLALLAMTAFNQLMSVQPPTFASWFVLT